LLLALKLTNVVYLFGPCVYIAVKAVRHRQWSWLLAVVAISVIVGGSSYVYAWLTTGNPVFPMFNTYFQSPYYPLSELRDLRWQTGFGVTTLWDLTFDTPVFMEAYPGAAGVAMLGLLGGVLLALMQRGSIRWVTAWFILAGIIVFAQVQYLRYVFPAIAVAGVSAIAALDRAAVHRGVLLAVAAVLCVINILLATTTSWIMHTGAWGGLVHQGRAYANVIVGRAAPHQLILSRLDLRDPGACVLVTDRAPFIGTLPDRAFSVAWYDPQLNRAKAWSDQDGSGARWKQTLEALGVSRVLIAQAEGPALRNALAQMDGRIEDRQAGMELWNIQGEGRPACRRDFVSSRNRAHRLLHAWDDHPPAPTPVHYGK
jgi:hypothetical protein